MEILSGGFVVLVAVCIVFAIVGLFLYKKAFEDGDMGLYQRGMVLLLAVITFAIAAVSVYGKMNIFGKIEDAQVKLNAGYKVYIDGEEVNHDKIDISQYQITINDAAKEIYLTNK